MNNNPDFNDDHTEEYDEGNLENIRQKGEMKKRKSIVRDFILHFPFACWQWQRQHGLLTAVWKTTCSQTLW